MTDRAIPHPPAAVLATAPILLVIVAGFVLAGMDAIAKHIGQLGVPVLLVLWGRYFFHTALPVACLVRRHVSIPHSQKACSWGMPRQFSF